MPSSGNPDLDRYLGKALERLADSFKIYPGFAFVDDSGSPNAYAMRETLLPRTRCTVLFGLQLFERSMIETNDQGLTVLAICAHKFGHVVQF